ncbi:hypothetical protein [Helicobacter apodemus]|uniref:Uncharacterized protein n=1 Tax=Helicobacter apodemus TaxID=135569 RepID=A0A2U8FBM8_9HELI|nr:hypothetical protein [Helicobacter apodemus]AWI33609.1 hypothetical protein CDV25_01670 [Helicobacter apodemus]
MLNSMERLGEIFKKSRLSINKFAEILHKDRRTLVSWINLKTKKELSEEIKEKICELFYYPREIWFCEDVDFFNLLHKIQTKEIKIIDDGYYGGLKYIFENENEGSLIIHPSFPNPAYRDFICPAVYKESKNEDIEVYRIKRWEKMKNYSFAVSEWYSIKSLLEFCFANIGNFYTHSQKIAILELMIETFKDNLNKNLYFFDSYDKKIYGLDLIYTSINIKEEKMFFKAPMESLIIEICNSEFVKKLHRHYTNAKECPIHITSNGAIETLCLLLDCIQRNLSFEQSCEVIKEKSLFKDLFLKSLSLDYRK